MKNAFFLSTLLCTSTALWGNETLPVGARSSSLANASVTLSDTWSTVNNQAGLGFVHDLYTGVYYENRFLLKELSTRSAAVAIPLKTSTLGFSFINFGYELYQENKYSVSFAKAFSTNFSMGAALDYLHTRISEENGGLSVLTGEIGMLVKLRKDLLLGFHLYNPTRSRLGKNTTERIPTLLKMGINYSFSSRVSFLFETEKDLSKKPLFKAAIEYLPLSHFYLRAGVSSNPSLSAFGFGFQLKNFQIDISSSYHQTLGINPQLGLSYLFIKKEKTDRDDL